MKKMKMGKKMTANIDNEINRDDNSTTRQNEKKPNKNNNIADISSIVSKDQSKEQIAGELSRNFGTGENAKINLILYIISTTLVIFSSIAAALMVINIFGFDTSLIIQYIKDLWSVFTPIITLGLGYLFGANKGEDQKQEEKK